MGVFSDTMKTEVQKTQERHRAKPPRTHARIAAASSQPRAALRTTLGDFVAASRPQDRRIRTAIVRHRRGTAPDPRPRNGCTPGLSCAADARGCTELGSRAKPGLGPRRSPQSAVLHRPRTKCRFAIARRSRGASARLRRYARERPQPGAAAGCNLPFMAMNLVPMGLNLDVSLRRRASKLPPSTNADEALAGCQYASAIRPMASACSAAEPRTSCPQHAPCT